MLRNLTFLVNRISGNVKLTNIRTLRGSTRTFPQADVSDSNTEIVSNEKKSNLPANSPDALKNYVPTFNLASYVNKSECLTELMKLGVDLSSIEKRKGLGEFVLKLDLDKDIKPHLLFLSDLGVSPDIFGRLITRNPLIFKEKIDDLQVRVNYLESKSFKPSQIINIVSRNPYWLMFPTKRIDRRLGYFQNSFNLSGDDVRFLATKQPNLITYKMEHVEKSFFTIKEEMGFDLDEMKCLLLAKPRLYMLNHDELVERFAFVHRQMKLSHDMILEFPEILTSRRFRVEQRHKFLETLGKAQYNPKEDLYVSPKELVSGTDQEFVKNTAHSDMVTYNTFLRNL